MHTHIVRLSYCCKL